MNKLKKTNTLFHSIREYESLKNIIKQKGFKASYANEVIGEFNVKILMVSFSNVALFESKSQIDYGDFSIGLTKQWGMKNNLQPVVYTYEESELGISFMEIIIITGRSVVRMQSDSPLKNDLVKILDDNINIIQYLKNIMVKNKLGTEFSAFNDREWRFVHKHGNCNSLIWEKNFLDNTDFEEYKSPKLNEKPYTNEVVLNFELSDVKYIIVEENSQKREIFDLLSSSYGKNNVLDAIVNGDLDIISQNSLWDNL